MAGVSNNRALWIARNVMPHEPALRAHLARWRLTGDLDIDDVVQEAYSRFAAIESIEQIRNPRAYLFSVARTIVLMHMRHARVISIRAIEDADALAVAADEPSPETQASDREQLHLLALAVSQLPEPGRRAFLMRVIDELPYQEIGARLGLSDNAVQKLVAKGLAQLVTRLGRGGSEGAGASMDKQGQGQDRNVRTRDQRGD